MTLGSWEDLQSRLDRLASAIVTDAPAVLEAGGTVFEMNDHRTHSPAPQSQSGTTELLTEPSNSGHVTVRAETALGVGLGPGNHAYPDTSRTPNPRAIPSRDLIPVVQQNNRVETRRRPVPGAQSQPSNDDIQHVGQDHGPHQRPGRLQSGCQSGSRQAYEHHHLNPGDGSNVI